MDRNLDFTYSPDRFNGLPSYVNTLKANGTRFIIILDPAIANGIPNYRPFDLGQQMDVWVKYADGQTPVEGRVGQLSVAFAFAQLEGEQATILNIAICTKKNSKDLFTRNRAYNGI